MFIINVRSKYTCSFTFDDAIVNLKMCKCLGANFDIGPHFQSYIMHSVTNEKVFCIFNPSHMIKLIRNILGDKPSK